MDNYCSQCGWAMNRDGTCSEPPHDPRAMSADPTAPRTMEPTAAEWLRETALNFDDRWADDSFRMDFADALAGIAAEVSTREQELVALLRRAALGEEPQIRAFHDPLCGQCLGCQARAALPSREA